MMKIKTPDYIKKGLPKPKKKTHTRRTNKSPFKDFNDRQRLSLLIGVYTNADPLRLSKEIANLGGQLR